MVCALPLLRSGRTEPPGCLPPIPRLLESSLLPVTEAALWSNGSGGVFFDFRRFPLRLLPPRGSPVRYSRPYDTAFDRFAPVSPDRILGLDATPAPRSGAVLPGSLPGSYSAPILANGFSPECSLTFLDFSIPARQSSNLAVLRAL